MSPLYTSSRKEKAAVHARGFHIFSLFHALFSKDAGGRATPSPRSRLASAPLSRSNMSLVLTCIRTKKLLCVRGAVCIAD